MVEKATTAAGGWDVLVVTGSTTEKVAEFVKRWGVCEHGHVLTDVNRDSQGRCWCCTRAHDRAFAVSEPDVSHGSSGGNLRWIPLRALLTQ